MIDFLFSINWCSFGVPTITVICRYNSGLLWHAILDNSPFSPNVIPVLSAHSDTKLVMKGITHGACDYLLKPVRIEELKNIWQHVIRRRKSDSKDRNRPLNVDMTCHGTEGRKVMETTGISDQDGKPRRKRKDQIGHEEEDDEDSGHENEDDSSTQKKPRVVWSVELHQKFVTAVKQLGLESECFTTMEKHVVFLIWRLP